MVGIVDAAVAGNVASGHLAVGRVYDGVRGQGGDVAFPQVEVVLYGCYVFLRCLLSLMIYQQTHSSKMVPISPFMHIDCFSISFGHHVSP